MFMLVAAPNVMAQNKQLTGNIQRCQSDLKADTRDNRLIRETKIDPTGLCVCVGLMITFNVTDKDIAQMARALRPNLSRAELIRNVCMLLMIEADSN